MNLEVARQDGAIDVQPLRPEDVPLLNPAGNPRIDETDIDAIVRRHPNRSFWVPETGEFILVQPWRSRDDLPHIHTLWSFGNDGPLLDAAAGAAIGANAASLVMLETGERRKPAFYHRYGFDRVEGIRTYEHSEPEVLARMYSAGAVQFHRVTRGQAAMLPDVEKIDHASFPWFWWNTHEEFLGYISFPGVELWAGERGGQTVSYFGITQFHQWAHLDRIAVASGNQRAGLGKTTVGFAARRMLQSGAVRIGLSTQSGNRISRRMYESLGFRHTRQSDYDVYGLVFDAERVYRSP